MKYIEVNITSTHDGSEHVEAKLLSTGIVGWQVIDYKEMRSFLASNPTLWDYFDDCLFDNEHEHVVIRFYLTDDMIGRATVEHLQSAIRLLRDSVKDVEFGELLLSTAVVDDEEWLDSWKKYFKPIELGDRLVIRPHWEQYSHPEKTIIAIDPGNAFGTGHHETTRLCLIALEKYIKPMNTMLDIGSGSGILSITGIKLGASTCTAVDMNPNAAAVTNKNAEINGISTRQLQILTGDVLTNDSLRDSLFMSTYDCIAANIIAETVIALAPLIVHSNCLKEGGVFIASGIIKDRYEDVLSSLDAAGYNVIDTLSENEWFCVIANLIRR